MADKVIKAILEKTEGLSMEDTMLLEEIKTISQESLKSIKIAFHQLITLSTTLIGLQIGLFQLVPIEIKTPLNAAAIFALLSVTFLLLTVIVSVFGQFHSKFDIPILDMLEEFRTKRNKMIKYSYRVYLLAGIFFVVGLGSFILIFFLNL
ncbi:MAG: hypothetical protein F6K19_30870 [Cyanothece sp. SIO1E1]|nr:hypothetical protein [Cyanothece sp. SIO1E1]